MTDNDADCVPEPIDDDMVSSGSRTTVNIRRPILPPVERGSWDDEPTKVEHDPVWARPGYELRFQRRQEQLTALYLRLLEHMADDYRLRPYLSRYTHPDDHHRRDRIIWALRQRLGR